MEFPNPYGIDYMEIPFEIQQNFLCSFRLALRVKRWKSCVDQNDRIDFVYMRRIYYDIVPGCFSLWFFIYRGKEKRYRGRLPELHWVIKIQVFWCIMIKTTALN